MKDIYCLRKPQIMTNLDGTNPREEWWGKFLKYGWNDGEEILFHPIFNSLWPGLWLKNTNMVRKPYWYEWIEYFFKLFVGRIKYFFHLN